MKIHQSKTIDYMNGEFLDVFECEICGARSIYIDRIEKHERNHKKEHHEEEAQAGII